jgi:type III secretory pathway component EscT
MLPAEMPGWWHEVSKLIEASGIDLRAWSLGWARVSPSVVLIPAFGLRALPAAARVMFALVLGLAISPAITSDELGPPWPLAFVTELFRGLPVAITAATVLWAASMAGGLADDLRGSRAVSGLPTAEIGATPFGALLSMLTAIVFLQSGGPSRLARALFVAPPSTHALLGRAIQDLVSGIELAIAVAAPLIVATVVIEVASALVTRAMVPAMIAPALAPLRSLVLLGVLAVLLERVLSLLALRAAQVP